MERKYWFVPWLMAAAIFGLLVTLTSPSCAKAPPTLSPAGRASFQAIKAVHVLDTIRDVAIAGEAQTPKVFSTSTTRHIVTLHQALVQTIGAVPDGWKPVAAQALVQLQRDLPAAEWTQLAPFVTLLQVIIQEVP